MGKIFGNRKSAKKSHTDRIKRPEKAKERKTRKGNEEPRKLDKPKITEEPKENDTPEKTRLSKARRKRN